MRVALEPTVKAPTCRRCSNCEGVDHHWHPNLWLGHAEADSGLRPDAPFICAHCGVYGDDCDYCGGSGEIETDNNGPIGACPICKGSRAVPSFNVEVSRRD